MFGQCLKLVNCVENPEFVKILESLTKMTILTFFKRSRESVIWRFWTQKSRKYLVCVTDFQHFRELHTNSFWTHFVCPKFTFKKFPNLNQTVGRRTFLLVCVWCFWNSGDLKKLWLSGVWSALATSSLTHKKMNREIDPEGTMKSQEGLMHKKQHNFRKQSSQIEKYLRSWVGRKIDKRAAS